MEESQENAAETGISMTEGPSPSCTPTLGCYTDALPILKPIEYNREQAPPSVALLVEPSPPTEDRNQLICHPAPAPVSITLTEERNQGVDTGTTPISTGGTSLTEMPRAFIDDGLKEYRIDGNTPVDDVLFASVFATMDNAVLGHLRDLKPLPPIHRDFDAVKAENREDDLESESSSDSSLEDELTIQEAVEATKGVSIDIVDSEDEVGGGRTGDEELTKLFQLPNELTQRLQGVQPAAVGEMRQLGVVLNEVEGLITVRSVTGGMTYDLASVCCNSNRQVIAVVVDTFGPTAAPFYVLQRIQANLPVRENDWIFVDVAQATIASVEMDRNIDL